MYVADRLEAGTVFINTYNKTDVAAPFGGFKQSGFGKDLGEFVQNGYSYLTPNTIWVRLYSISWDWNALINDHFLCDFTSKVYCNTPTEQKLSESE